jgi:hypothetical protein
MKAIADLKTRCVTSIRELLELPGWDAFRDDKLGNDLFISDPDRANRIYDAAADGADGSTHAEVIEDWTEFAGQVYDEIEREAWNLDVSQEEADALEAFIEEARAKLDADIERCE